jgi:hypothetical protein
LILDSRSNKHKGRKWGLLGWEDGRVTEVGGGAKGKLMLGREVHPGGFGLING